MHMAISELCDNALQHGRNDLGVYVAANQVEGPLLGGLRRGDGQMATLLVRTMPEARIDIRSAEGRVVVALYDGTQRADRGTVGRGRRGTLSATAHVQIELLHMAEQGEPVVVRAIARRSGEPVRC